MIKKQKIKIIILYFILIQYIIKIDNKAILIFICKNIIYELKNIQFDLNENSIEKNILLDYLNFILIFIPIIKIKNIYIVMNMKKI